MRCKQKQIGQAAVEYIVALMVIAVMLGFGFAGDGSVITLFLAAVEEAFEKFSSFLSLP